MTYWQQGKRAEAAPHLRTLLQLDPQPAAVAQRFGQMFLDQKKPDEAARAWTFMARALAASPVDAVRNAEQAVKLGQRAVELSGGKDPQALDALAAAYAEAKRFPEAVETVKKAIELAARQGSPDLAERKARLRLYEAGTPFRETWPPLAASAKP
jgi:tetratricopeptide (TPR) repeat protein